MNVTVGGVFKLVTQLTVSTGSLFCSGEFWLMFPVCSVRKSENSEPDASPVLLRPDLTVVMSNAITQLRVTQLLSTPNCLIRPGYAYQRFAFTGVFDQVGLIWSLLSWANCFFFFFFFEEPQLSIVPAGPTSHFC